RGGRRSGARLHAAGPPACRRVQLRSRRPPTRTRQAPGAALADRRGERRTPDHARTPGRRTRRRWLLRCRNRGPPRHLGADGADPPGQVLRQARHPPPRGARRCPRDQYARQLIALTGSALTLTFQAYVGPEASLVRHITQMLFRLGRKAVALRENEVAPVLP